MSRMTNLFTSTALGVGGFALARFGAGPVEFTAAAAPAILATTGASLPPLWWLLSTLPPKPIKEYFPGITLLFNADTQKLKPTTMPAWHKALCLSIPLAAGISASLPEFKEDIVTNAKGPVIVAVDNGWASAGDWEGRQTQMEIILDAASREDRQIVIVPTAETPNNGPENPYFKMMGVAEARSVVEAIEPQSWPVDYEGLIAPLQELRGDIRGGASVFWLSDGLQPENGFAETLASIGPLTVYQNENVFDGHMLSLGENQGEKMIIEVARIDAEQAASVNLTALNEIGQPLIGASATFEEGQNTAQAEFNVTPEIRAALARVAVDNERSSGATLLLDENWRERKVGIIDTGLNEPLLDGASYIERAIGPFTDMQRGSLGEILANAPSVIVLTDDAHLTQSEIQDVQKWIAEGGTLIRFAGPNLANNPEDPLLPVQIHEGIRSTQNTFDGSAPGKVSDFANGAPLAGLTAPDNLEIKRVVLGEASPELAERTWASLSDGTPFVTGRTEGKGSLVLVHTTANMEWSNLPLSGAFFLNMMKSIVAHAHGGDKSAQLNRDLQPIVELDHEGRLMRVDGDVRPLTQEAYADKVMSKANPPGYYGNSDTRLAYNVSDVQVNFAPLGELPAGTKIMPYQQDRNNFDWGAVLLLLAATAMAADATLRKRSGHTPAAPKTRSLFRRRDDHDMASGPGGL